MAIRQANSCRSLLQCLHRERWANANPKLNELSSKI